MARIIDARVRQKAATLEEWNNSDLDSLDGEQLFVRSDVDDKVIGFKLGAKGKKFSELDYPDFTVRGKVSPVSTWVGRQSGVYIPTSNGVYNGVTVNLSEGYQVLYWDGNTIEKVVYPADYTSAVFGGVIDDSKDLSTPPTEPTWYIASPGDYNTTPSITLTENSILTWDGNEWSHIPFELEVRGEFLVADNVAELRSITPEVAQLLVNGTYKGVEVLGYYEKGDTPASIIYYLSDTTEEDDGGSVFEVGGIKLEHEFVGKVDVKYFGCLEGEDCTERIQNCINAVKEGSTVLINGDYFSTSDYGWFNQGIRLRSNVDIELNGSITLLPSSHGQYNIFSGYNISNFNIYGNGSVIGDKFRHLNSPSDTNFYQRRTNNTSYSSGDFVYIAIYGLKVVTSGTSGTTQPPITGATLGQTINDGSVVYEVVSVNLGEQGYGFSFYECSNFSMNGITIKECWGDGYILSGTRYTEQENIGCRDFNISFVKSENNRRQGLSIMGARNGSIYSCFFNNTYGTTPQAGIDFEPNNREVVRSISIDSCYFNDNEGAGIQIYNKHSLAILEDISITSCFFKNNRNALYFREPNVTSINVSGIFSSSSTQQAVVFIDGAENVTIKDITIRNSPQAFQFNGANNVNVENIDIEGATVAAIGMSGNGLTNSTLKRGSIRGSSQYGILSSKANNVTFEDLLIESSGTDGIRFDGGSSNDIKFKDIKVYNSQNYGMFLNNISDFSIQNSKFKNNGISIDNSMSHIRCGVGCSVGIVESNVFRTDPDVTNVARYCVLITADSNNIQVGLNDYRTGFKQSAFSSASSTSNISQYDANSNTKGFLKQGAHVPNGSSVDTLLASLRDAGIIASS